MGAVGLSFNRRNLPSPFHEIPEVGWLFLPQHQGKGYAYEAVAKILAWSDESLKKYLFCFVDSVNKKSIDLANKCGFEFVCDSNYCGNIVKVYVRRI